MFELCEHRKRPLFCSLHQHSKHLSYDVTQSNLGRRWYLAPRGVRPNIPSKRQGPLSPLLVTQVGEGAFTKRMEVPVSRKGLTVQPLTQIEVYDFLGTLQMLCIFI